MTHLDLFSGAGGFSLGLKQAGFPISKTYFSEIDKHAIANYKHKFKDAEYIGSVADVRGGDLGKIVKNQDGSLDVANASNRVLIKSDCVYIQALNEKNAIRKFRKQGFEIETL